MKKCIICRKKKEEKEFNIEHIIPNALEGNICCNNICVDCNSLLGARIDVYLTNSILVSFDRDRYNLTGRKKRVLIFMTF